MIHDQRDSEQESHKKEMLSSSEDSRIGRQDIKE
jgi:hypothetical protein